MSQQGRPASGGIAPPPRSTASRRPNNSAYSFGNEERSIVSASATGPAQGGAQGGAQSSGGHQMTYFQSGAAGGGHGQSSYAQSQ